MFHFDNAQVQDKKAFYQQVNTYLESMIRDEPDWLAGIANASALLYQMMSDVGRAFRDKVLRVMLRPCCTK